jgi:hypothetical protein
MTDLDLLSRSNDSTQSSFSQELRLDYNGNDLHATGGFFYFTQDLDNIANTHTKMKNKSGGARCHTSCFIHWLLGLLK